MSKPKQWKQGRELKHADAWKYATPQTSTFPNGPGTWMEEMFGQPYPQEAEQPDRLWVGSGDAS